MQPLSDTELKAHLVQLIMLFFKYASEHDILALDGVKLSSELTCRVAGKFLSGQPPEVLDDFVEAFRRDLFYHAGKEL
jgi:hypothetical protein